MLTSKIASNHTIYHHVLNAETANPVNWYIISGEGDCGEGDCGEGDYGEGEWIPRKIPTCRGLSEFVRDVCYMPP